MNQDRQRTRILIARLYERFNRQAGRYFSGQLEGGTNVIMRRIPGKFGPRGEPAWELFNEADSGTPDSPVGKNQIK